MINFADKHLSGIMKLYILTVIISVFLLVSCSSSGEAVREEEQATTVSEAEAMEHYIEGSILASKQDYEGAVRNFLMAEPVLNNPAISFALARNYLEMSKLPQALKYAEKAVKADSLNAEYQTLLAEVYLAAGNSALAESSLNKVVELDSLNILALYNLAAIYEKDQPLKSLEYYKKVLKISGPEWDVLVKVANLYERTGNTKERTKTFEQLLALNPSSLDLQKIMIEVYLRELDYAKAETLVDQASQLFPDDSDLMKYKIQIILGKKDYDKIGGFFSSLKDNKNVSQDDKLQISSLLLLSSQIDTLLAPYAKDVILDTGADSLNWQTIALQAELLQSRGEDSLAADKFIEASKAAPWNVELIYRAAGILLDNNEYEKASIVLEDAAKDFQGNYIINLMLGLSYTYTNRYEEAEPLLLESIKTDPDNLNLLYSLGFTLYRLDKKTEAVEYLERALRKAPDNYGILGLLGSLYDSRKEYDKADSVFNKSLEINPDDPTIMNNYAYSLSERGTQLDKALEYVTKSLEADPENSSYLDTKAWVFFKMGDFANALPFIEKAIEVDNDNSVLYDHYGDILYKLGRNAEASEMWRKALNLDKTNEKLIEKIKRGSI